MTAFSVTDLQVGVHRQTIVKGIGFDLEPGRTLGIVGESGSGKSLTVLAATGLFDAPGGWVQGSSVLSEAPAGDPGTGTAPETAPGTTSDRASGTVPGSTAAEAPTAARQDAPRAGDVEIVGLGKTGLRRLHGNRIGFVFQDPATSLNPLLTLEDQLTEGPITHLGMSREQARTHALELLAQVGLPDPETRLRYYPHQLSGGQKQRMMIAIALACDPELLIADEPTTALDVTTQAQIIDLVAGLQRERNMAVVWISHDLGVIGRIADDVIVMRGGEVVERGPVREIFDRPQHDYTRLLLDSRPLLDSVTGTDAHVSPAEAGAGADAAAPASGEPGGTAAGEHGESGDPSEPAGSAPLLRISDLTVTFDIDTAHGKSTVTAVDDASMAVRPGRTLGIVGESGSGKSTIANVLTGLVEPASGTVELGGESILGVRGAAAKAVKRRIAMVFQDPFAALDPRMSVQRALSEPLIAHSLAPRAQRRERCRDLLDQVGLDASYLDRYPHEMSGGQRQRVCIARALAVDPEVLILDESTASLDVSIQAQVLDLLAELQAERGFAYVFIAHDLAVVEQISHEVVVMKDGRVVESGPAAQILTSPRTDYTRALIDAVPPREPARA